MDLQALMNEEKDMNRKRIIVQLISLSLFLAACIAAQPIPPETLPPSPIPLKSTQISATNTLIPPSPTPAATATEALSEFPTGSFHNASLAATIVLNEDGTWTFLVQGDAFLLGDYTVEGNLVTLSDVSARCSGLGSGQNFWTDQII